MQLPPDQLLELIAADSTATVTRIEQSFSARQLRFVDQE
jgi:hypothetical protein